ncbi:MAG: immunoglobulin domain-containing protein [Phycisphaeraceae bacterium]|nr:immunoglobulin domain-containing protein [Phycisphaeraceae bacterium]
MKTRPARSLAALAGTLVPGVLAHAQIDRIIDTETGWAYLYGATSTTINSQISAGMRPFCFERIASGQYDTVLVSNSGSYAMPGAQVLYGATPASVTTWLSNNNLRLLELETYDSSGSTFMTAVGVPNSGATAAPGWGWVYNVTWAQIVSWLNANPTLRLIDLDAYRIGGTLMYSAVAVPNTGANFQSGWWYGTNMTAQDVTDALTNNSARLISIEVEQVGTLLNPNLRFACVMVSQNPGGGWWHHAATAEQVAAMLDANSARLSCLKRYTNVGGQTRYAVAMIDNGNAQTRRMRSYLWNANSGGSTGFMLKQVGGPVLAANNVNFQWEPCSTVKLLHAIHAIEKCSNNQDNLGNNVLYKNLCASCPFTWTCIDQYRTLTTSLTNLLQPSDNYALIALERRFGYQALSDWAIDNGFPNIQINRLNCDCGVVLNTATCADFAVMLEKAHDGTFFDSTWEGVLHDHMNNLSTLGYNSYSTLSSIINAESASTNLTASEVSAFRAAVEFVNKGGSYSCSSGLRWRTEGGWAKIPFKVNSGPFGWLTLPREYTFTLFAHNATNEAGAAMVHPGKEEILREQIREALQSWDAACSTPGFLSQPSPQLVVTGGTAQFSCVALPNPATVTFQWYRGQLPLSNGPTGNGSTISGATNATLTISNAQPGDAASYSVRLTTACGTATSNSVSLTVTSGSCYANCDGSTGSPILTANDFQCFLNKYAANNTYANCDGSTGTPLLTANDFQCFLNKYAAGCS